MMKTAKTFLTFIPFFTVLLLNAACSGKKAGSDNSWQPPSDLAWPAIALLETGENPIWFELGENGPELIESPSASSLNPYVPWPYAKFIVGMRFWNGFLVMAVNRDGFIALGKGRNSNEAALYRISGSPFFSQYTAESFFLWNNRLSVLLYRNDFFMKADATPLVPQVYSLDLNSPVPIGVSIAALENFSGDDLRNGEESSGMIWEAEILRRGNDGFWYYRVKEKPVLGRKGKTNPEVAYFRSENLEGEGVKISIGEWRNSNRPEEKENIPAQFAPLLARLGEFGFTGYSVLKLVSADFPDERVFALPEHEETQALLYGFRASPEASGTAILLLSPNGKGLYRAREDAEISSFSLPELPENFVYTGIAALGNVLAASWEEQQEAGIGAAGFMTQLLKN